MQIRPASFIAPFFSSPVREYALVPVILLALAADFATPYARPALAAAAVAGVLPTLWEAATQLRARRIGIDAFNAFAICVSVATLEFRSAAFIALMLAFARLLDWRTASRTRDAVDELLRLKPLTAFRVAGGVESEVAVDDISVGDVLVIKIGSRVPVDGDVIFGEAHMNESSVSGESAPVRKVPGDPVLSGTLAESGALKIRATRVGKDSTVERMAALMRKASAHKSRAEKAADRFAGWFLPLVAALGVATYAITRDASMTAAIFLIACADDVAVAIPLAMTASLGAAAKRGVIVKGGEWLEALSRARIVVLDKTGTLTYGSLKIADAHVEADVDPSRFWSLLGSAEKYSEHPIGRAIYAEAVRRTGAAADPDKFEVRKGQGVTAVAGTDVVLAGNEQILAGSGIALTDDVARKLRAEREEHGQTTSLVIINGKFAGLVTVADVPRTEAAESVQMLRRHGVRRIIMLTGDSERVAADVALRLGITEHRSSMTPDEKLRVLDGLAAEGGVVMIGDGINDAPALARADVGIAMGKGGAAVAVEAADVVILTDDLSRVPELIRLGRRTMAVIRDDIWIWVVSNLIGFALVLTGVAGPALAAFYNFATDFLPLLNSTRLFRAESARKSARA